ncbi:DUF1272 domain-containing protein [Leptospira kmetyi]|uniref:DUF1272 domain-containing protein n=1 Tax=Leptospira kmetyi TaxID=408139 RepID=A0A2M9XM18_9LEPT|nr:DUF1272 domain-containing protein [Leptospira kmetyi]AYV57592.1 DUF1272 domain-containing protein [Leptospira kmetyi]PJZ31314.1 DUF1272 domain-containing protein [Leptospira kmetyi]PJZ40350.1 DUF1272 domain-containing protein [Leptospira kmetyi]TGK18303.1 DUF1272 domain-containing protein [Leptospira kmetyi]TGK26685.1 DUF1272 domain-containing protein [Leptospira kmetyi]
MLELRPSCENCDKPLPPESTEAMICTFECTFCVSCYEQFLFGICPNCGGNFVPRPIRPVHNWNDDNYLGKYPASTKKKFRPINTEAHLEFVKKLSSIPPEKR